MSKVARSADEKPLYSVVISQYLSTKQIVDEFASANGSSVSYLSTHLFTLGLSVPIMRQRFGVVHLDMAKVTSILIDRVLGIHAVDDPRRPLVLQSRPIRNISGSDPLDKLNPDDEMFEVAVVLWPNGYAERFDEACFHEGARMVGQAGVGFDFHRARDDSRKYQAIERLLCPEDYYNCELYTKYAVAS